MTTLEQLTPEQFVERWADGFDPYRAMYGQLCDMIEQAKLEGIRLGLKAAGDLVCIYPCSGISNDLFRHGREFGLAFVEDQINKRSMSIVEYIVKLDPATILAASEKP